jgi:hypothetical protein
MADGLATELRDWAETVACLDAASLSAETRAQLTGYALDLMHRAADVLDTTSATPPVGSSLCGYLDLGPERHSEPCDRPVGHKGDHSQEAWRLRHRLIDLEAKALEYPRLRSRVADLESRLRKSERALTEANRHWWQHKARQAKKVADRG